MLILDPILKIITPWTLDIESQIFHIFHFNILNSTDGLKVLFFVMINAFNENNLSLIKFIAFKLKYKIKLV